ncbi:ADP-ribosyl cyclase/cyclic ADP-ribose hydrolase 1-like [Menidia menidia]
MEQGGTRGSGKRRRKRLLLCVSVVVVIIAICAVVLGVTLAQGSDGLKNTFLERCQKFKGYNCEEVWDVFQKAYVNQDPCKVPTEAYDPLVASAPIEPSCNRAMFWSKTKDVVHDFTGKTDCFVTVEDSLLGSVLDGLTWCGKEGSSETLTTGCPDWNECPDNPVGSFWKRISAAFADAACGNVTAMLNGSITEPFNSRSIFASIEVTRFKSPRMKNLNVVLVMDEKAGTNCTDESLNNLQKQLDEGIKYNCKEVPQSQIEECSSRPEKTCGSCW